MIKKINRVLLSLSLSLAFLSSSLVVSYVSTPTAAGYTLPPIVSNPASIVSNAVSYASGKVYHYTNKASNYTNNIYTKLVSKGGRTDPKSGAVQVLRRDKGDNLHPQIPNASPLTHQQSGLKEITSGSTTPDAAKISSSNVPSPLTHQQSSQSVASAGGTIATDAAKNTSKGNFISNHPMESALAGLGVAGVTATIVGTAKGLKDGAHMQKIQKSSMQADKELRKFAKTVTDKEQQIMNQQQQGLGQS